MYRSEGLHSVYKFKEMFRRYEITGIVTEWDNGYMEALDTGQQTQMEHGK